ncbi:MULTISPECIES: DUF262 domain-containing protein [unclassified Adlercreutzia]|uniref:DUF262 domain-containing protein n=1 Tax=unclassified Adlercreutzia TaxID=2636013 RepID=UPI0013ED6249|nr:MULTISPECIES: DUF262 domain-containing protein [unclassified Adlercreutzia]
MSKLNIDQKTIKDLLTAKKADFLIPDYQRPYAWTEDECGTLWDDLFAFALPGEGEEEFDENEEYFLGPIVTFRNADDKLEIIDGQQRLTTIMLLLRAFCSKFEFMKDGDSKTMHADLETCIWKTGALNKVDKTKLKIDSEVASDKDKEEFLSILSTGEVKVGQKSKYAKTFVFYQDKISELVSKYPTYVAIFVWRILNNVILLPIEAESQGTALRIFSTLNDRGLPLSDADIFKSQFYKFFSDRNEKDRFIERWKALEDITDKIFKPSRGTPMDELFTRYMYYERAKQGNRNTTTEALRDFYERDSYKLLKSEETLENLEALAAFWMAVSEQDDQLFSKRVLRRLFVLSYAPNGMWAYIVSVWFMTHKDKEDKLDEVEFYEFLHKITAFIWAYAIERPGVNSLRTPVYPELIRIVKGEEVEFAEHRFDHEALRGRFMAYAFNNGRPITRSMLAWWAFEDEGQPLLELNTVFEIEHIYAKKRAEVENGDKSKLEALGNKALLEKRINIRASDYRFEDKKKYYRGFESARGYREGTGNRELLLMADGQVDFTMQEIDDRTERIIDSFMEYLGANSLLLA